MDRIADSAEIALERFRLPFDTVPTKCSSRRLAKAGGPAGYNASVQLARLDRGEPLPINDVLGTTWKFGDKLLMVFLPGEVVVDYVLRLKTELDPSRLWVTAYANDLPCYIPSGRILREGGFIEGGGAMVYYGRPTRLKPGVEQLIIGTVHRLAGPDFARPAAQAAVDGMPRPLPPDEVLFVSRKPGPRWSSLPPSR